ncbi:CsbD family protein [Nitrosococcus watsonii]|uniref:CsbD family protein n=1 Tax=Nitrosococcus watsoni (strain C-113) TaxID=105559 RepID=D8K9Q5_NITWC|nr:CsbD family protein [Nitrosococcus watsonii]ADJ27344.1 CsbD family protein [Nitrosococcus watsonii C-113]
MPVNWDQIEGNWKQFKGHVRQKWGKLTDDEIDEAAGNKDILAGKIQERYGIEREEAEKEVEDFKNSL